jgi:glyoxylase-like metal-dependent hydrolase (beta-lactamase superfamily II)
MVHEDGSLVFAAARHFMPRGEWGHWTDPAYLRRLATDEPQRLELLTRYLLPLEPALTLIEAGKEILPGFQAITAPGHTVAHTALRIESEGDVLYYLGDAMLHPLFGIYPDWQFFNDVDHRLAARTRQQLREGVTAENALVLGYHFPFPLLGRFSRHDTDYTWQPFTPPVAIND